MEVSENIVRKSDCNRDYDDDDDDDELLMNHEDDDVPLPGFRFHPTDEELVGFYLRRKVHNRPISIELIKQIDIYKYDPWDLPKSSNVGDKEWYFYCKRGRKYRNSIRPNRVTGSGFWKATGIDKPIYASSNGTDVDSNNNNRLCIGLKKSLVYYRGSAGKGTKTDWMMHEFRLPLDDHKTNKPINDQDAEVWTLCRILKRNVSFRKGVPEWREVSAAKRSSTRIDASSKSCSAESNNCQSYISFTDPTIQQHNICSEIKPFSHTLNLQTDHKIRPSATDQLSSLVSEVITPTSYLNVYSTTITNNETLLKHRDTWDELGSLVGIAANPFTMYNDSYNMM